MNRTARSRSAMPAVLASVLVGAIPLVSACGAGDKAPTRLEYSVADGVGANAGNVVLRNLQLTADVGGQRHRRDDAHPARCGGQQHRHR